LQYEAKYSLCSNHLIIMITVLKFYSSLISFFLQVIFTMLFFFILYMKLSYFISLFKIFFVLFTLYYKHSFSFMFKVFYKSLNFYSQLILIIINLSSFYHAIMNSYLSLYNVIYNKSLICNVKWNLWLKIYLLLTWTSLINDSFFVFNLINLFYIALMIEDLIISCNIYYFIQ